ncbi:uncharacterized protein YlxW (UPF0749 family) [Cellulosimicrobium cellulans J34]|nr:uncharacterized protein YlxW (UPF0749 family) [Cellulosimicrobium cellulans J34]SMF01553.1 Uncharacterized conserved protein YlxW, UPF0749 family [Cellulosimicrobium cellulans J1]
MSVSPDPRDRTGADTPQDQTPAAVDPDVAETGPPAPTDATADAGRTDDGRTTDTPVAETSSDDAPAPDEDVPADGSAPDDAREAADAATEPADEAADAVGTAATEPDAPAPAQEPAPTDPDDEDTGEDGGAVASAPDAADADAADVDTADVHTANVDTATEDDDPAAAVDDHATHDDAATDPSDARQAADADEPGDATAAPGAATTPGQPEPPTTTGAIGAVGRHGTPSRPEPRGLRGLGSALRPRASRSQIVVGVLCALLGFALVVQVSQTQEDQLSSLRQSDLVRLLDDVTQRSGELEDQVSSLEATRDELQSGSGRERAALELAEEQAQTLGILSGRLPAEGPGVTIDVVEGPEALDAFALFNVLEELRNAGAEAMEVNGVRLVASSYFEDSADGVVVDGQTIESPYRWSVIGDPSTLETALEIPGGAMASLRADGARTTVTQEDRVEVGATVEPRAPEYATPVPADE